jgi:hypothetical protein
MILTFDRRRYLPKNLELLPLNGIVWIARTLSSLPGSAVETPWVSAWMIALYYILLILILMIATLKRNNTDEA